MLYLVGEMAGAVLRASGRPFAARLSLPRAGGDCPRRDRLDIVPCGDCPHLVLDAAGSQHCQTSGREPVGQWMVPLTALVAVASDGPAAAALAAARCAHVHHVLVLDRERTLVGVTCATDLERAADGPVAAAMSADVYATGPATPLAEAAQLMHMLGIGSLPVLGDGVVLGLITRDQLRQAGAPV